MTDPHSSDEPVDLRKGGDPQYRPDPAAPYPPYPYPPQQYPPQQYPPQQFPPQQYPPQQYPPQQYPPQQYPPPLAGPGAYGPPGQPWGYPPPYPRPGTNGMAVASMILGILWIYWIGSILAVIFGFVARGQIKQRGQDGDGMAIAGLVLGWIGVGTLLIFLGFGVAYGGSYR